MKQHSKTLMAILMIALTAWSSLPAMAQKMIKDLPAAVTPTTTSVVPVDVEISPGVWRARKITLSNLSAVFSGGATDADITSLAAISGTNVIPYRSAADTWGTITLGMGLTFTAGNLSLTGVGLTANSLSQFAATTSAQLREVISDEAGTGPLVFATSPTLETPTLGVATATSINGLTITTSTGTLTIANGKTATVNNTLIFTGTDGTTHTFPSTSSTLARTDAAQTFTGKQTFADLELNGTQALNLTTTGTINAIGETTNITSPSVNVIASGSVNVESPIINLMGAGGNGLVLDDGSATLNMFGIPVIANALGGAVSINSGDITATDDKEQRLTNSNGALPLVVAHTSAAVTVANTTTETNLFSAALQREALKRQGGVSHGAVRVTLAGTYTNNSGVNRTVQLAVKLGTTTLWRDTSVSLGASATSRRWECSFVIQNTSAATQKMGGTFAYSVVASSPTTGTGPLATESLRYLIGGSSSEDTNVAKTIAFTVIHSAAAATITMTCDYGIVEVLP